MNKIRDLVPKQITATKFEMWSCDKITLEKKTLIWEQDEVTLTVYVPKDEVTNNE